MKVIYALQPLEIEGKSIFLAGPTPRNNSTYSWRPEALEYLSGIEVDTVFVPEPEDHKWTVDYAHQANWEHECLERSDLILFWVPRNMVNMPALTTNVEFGLFIKSGKVLYGRPDWAAKVRYLDWLYEKETGRKPINKLSDLIIEANTFLKELKND